MERVLVRMHQNDQMLRQLANSALVGEPRLVPVYCQCTLQFLALYFCRCDSRVLLN